MIHPQRIFALSLLVVASFAVAARATDEVTARYSFSASNPLTQASRPVGDLGVDAAFLNWGSSLALSEATKLNYGVAWSAYNFTRPAAMAAPDRLQEITLSLGGTHRLSPRWLLIGSIEPGLYGDLKGSTRDAFNAPVLALATYLQSRELAWSFGLRADALSDNPVIPIVGVNWRFAPDWEFTLGFPRAGFGYTVSPALKLGLGATVQGGSFYVAEDPRPAAPGVRLNDTYLDYREIRVGLSADYEFSKAFSLAVEGGVITDQKLDYYERGYTLNGDAAAFFTVALTGRF
jgi:hypothetical protein